MTMLTAGPASAHHGEAMPPSAPAARGRRRWWSDPRLVVGVVLVAACAGGGALLLGGGEGTAVWVAARDLDAGTTIGPQDLVMTTVDLGETSAAYADGAVMPSGRLARPVLAGEILPAAAVSDAVPSDLRLVTVPVDPLHAPSGLGAGDHVDVWSTPQAVMDGEAGEPQLVLGDVVVSEVGYDETGASSELRVVLEVATGDVAAVVAAARIGDVDLVRIPLQARP